MKKINVLMVGSDLSVRGGMTTVVQFFLEHRNNEVYNMTFIPTHRDGSSLLKVLYFCKSIINIILCLIFKKIDIVHIHMSERGSFKRKFIIFRISKLFKRAVITHLHGAEFKEFYLESSSKNRSKIRLLLRESDKVITLGKNWNDTIKEIEPSVDSIIIRNAVKIPKYQNKLNSKQVSILFLAVLNERKGIIDLIKASKKVINEIKREGREVKFVIAGDGPLYEISKNLIKDNNQDQYFEFHGWVNNKHKHILLRNTDVFVLPSYNEGLPLSILEAMSYGIPIVATDVGSINDAVIDNRNGYLIEPGNIEQLSNSILKVLDNNNLYKMGNESRKISKSLFNSVLYQENIQQLYKDIINKDISNSLQ